MAEDKPIRKYLEAVKKDMIAAQSNLGIRASGRSATSLKIVGSRVQGARLEGVGYWPFQDRGRRPGKFPPVNSIMQWANLPKVQIHRFGGRAQTPEQRAFMIGRKIAMFGTDIFTGRRQGINLDAILKKHLKKLGEGVGQKIALEYVEELDKTISV